MYAGFSLMEQHLEAPRAPLPYGKVVLSRLAPGRSRTTSPVHHHGISHNRTSSRQSNR